MKYCIFFLILFSFALSIWAQTESSISIYTKKIDEYDKTLIDIGKNIEEEYKQIQNLAVNLINNDISTSHLDVTIENKAPLFFQIVSFSAKMNGKPISISDLKRSKFTIYSSSIDPGEYLFTFEFSLKGIGYKVFSYMEGYKYNIKKEVKVTVPIIGKARLDFNIYKIDDEVDPKKYLGIDIKVQ
ncbi:hypothetical protein JXR93_13490 [bacterium]|nr:hypothetical protein [bacterium]